uniref:E3 ubiquitin-protein ligase Siah1 n=1 Tax=Caligus clemensi TaxID=344056 RepID=C1C1K5_CALCM|nr:E3 ubiquitin-protein ligase Siah1 [Caligus clemensi]
MLLGFFTSSSTVSTPKKDPKLHGGVLNNGSVLLRINSRAESSEEDSDSEEEGEQSRLEDLQEAEEPEDPLDIEEKELIQKLSDKENMSYTEECDLRKRLFDIKTIKFKKNQTANEGGVSVKFQKIANEISDSKSKAKEEEKKILVKRLNSSQINEVEQKDLQVRLQEILRDQKTEIESSINTIESHYEHILEETTTELTEIESSIRGKNQLVEKLQEEILSMNVRKEVLNEEIESLHNSHGESLKKFEEIVSGLDGDISKYSVLVPVERKKSIAPGSSLHEEELKEIEGELECPVCMDISRPPIYQCEEGHIICSTCKPLLTNCPHCATKYSEPAIRCRFAEKLSLRYFSLAEDKP